MRTCARCGRGIEDDFRFCPGCGTPQRVKVVEYFNGDARLDDGGLRVSVYLTSPQHVRFSIWRRDCAEAALSLDPVETDRLARFLDSLSRAPRTRVSGRCSAAPARFETRSQTHFASSDIAILGGRATAVAFWRTGDSDLIFDDKGTSPVEIDTTCMETRRVELPPGLLDLVTNHVPSCFR